MTASPVAPLARVDVKCMDLDGTTLKTTRCLSVSQSWSLEPPREPRWSPRSLGPFCAKTFAYRSSGLGTRSTSDKVTCALLVLWGVHRYHDRLFLAPTMSPEQWYAKVLAQWDGPNDRSGAVSSHPHVQQAGLVAAYLRYPAPVGRVTFRSVPFCHLRSTVRTFRTQPDPAVGRPQ